MSTSTLPGTCPCCGRQHITLHTEPSLSPDEKIEDADPPIIITTSMLTVSVKEIFILLLIFLLLLYSIISFLSNWSKNYREINHLPYYAIALEDTEQLPTGMSSYQSFIPLLVHNQYQERCWNNNWNKLFLELHRSAVIFSSFTI